MTDTGRQWEHHADWWQREFTDGADPEYEEQIVPLLLDRLVRPGIVPDGGIVVDVGTGEGQLARIVEERTGATVVGVDPARAQIVEAAHRGDGPIYTRAVGSALPLRNATVDAVLVCLVLEHVDDLDASLSEASRVLRPGGRFLLFMNHPLLQTPGSGLIVDHVLDPPETYWRIGPYLPESATMEEVHKDVFVRFVHRPLSRYVNGLVAVGLQVVHMAEPAPPSGFLAKATEYEQEVVRTTPRLLLLEATKPLDTMDPE